MQSAQPLPRAARRQGQPRPSEGKPGARNPGNARTVDTVRFRPPCRTRGPDQRASTVRASSMARLGET
eukprot:15033005-Alexandrium_andersonii.AAC.1